MYLNAIDDLNTMDNLNALSIDFNGFYLTMTMLNEHRKSEFSKALWSRLSGRLQFDGYVCSTYYVLQNQREYAREHIGVN